MTMHINTSMRHLTKQESHSWATRKNWPHRETFLKHRNLLPPSTNNQEEDWKEGEERRSNQDLLHTILSCQSHKYISLCKCSDSNSPVNSAEVSPIFSLLHRLAETALLSKLPLSTVWIFKKQPFLHQEKRQIKGVVTVIKVYKYHCASCPQFYATQPNHDPNNTVLQKGPRGNATGYPWHKKVFCSFDG